MLTMKNQKEKLKNQSHAPLQQKKNKISRNKLPKETKELYIENCKTLMKEIKDDINRWRHMSSSWIKRIKFLDQKNQYYEND